MRLDKATLGPLISGYCECDQTQTAGADRVASICKVAHHIRQVIPLEVSILHFAYFAGPPPISEKAVSSSICAMDSFMKLDRVQHVISSPAMAFCEHACEKYWLGQPLLVSY
jgi:hypothetical protein